MPDTLTTLLPLLSLLATAGGSGYAASWLFDAARRRWPRPTRQAWQASNRWERLAWELLYAPQQARLTVFVLAAATSLVASTLLAALTERDALAALDAALAIVVSQLIHAAGLSARISQEGRP
jgi:hypothetical protein